MKFLIFLSLFIYFICGASYSLSEDFKIIFSPQSSPSYYILKMINNSKKHIDACLYDIDKEEIINALLNKAKYIKINLVVDKEEVEDELIEQFKKGDINIYYDTRRDIFMHNKFFIFDDEYVLTGSYNPTKGQDEDHNNIIIVRSKELARNYKEEMQEFLLDNFGTGTPTKSPKIQIENIKLENYFAPEDKVKEKILEKLKQAKRCIYFAMFYFTDTSYSEELIEKYKKGIWVEGIIDKSSKEYKPFKDMRQANIKVITSDRYFTMHNKFIIIDLEVVITGSFNLTKQANTQNDENILIIHDKEIAWTYYNAYRAITGALEPVQLNDKPNIINYFFISPNPSYSGSKITFAYHILQSVDDISLNIYNLAGELVQKIFLKPKIGYNEDSLLLDLAPGIYLVMLYVKNNTSEEKKFFKLVIL